MNNDITRDVNNYINMPKNGNTSQGKSCDALNLENSQQNIQKSQSQDIDMEKSMSCMLGKLQVNSKQQKENNSVKESVESFLGNYDFVQNHIDLCDELVQKGYSLEQAILKTDMFFNALKKQDTYRQ